MVVVGVRRRGERSGSGEGVRGRRRGRRSNCGGGGCRRPPSAHRLLPRDRGFSLADCICRREEVGPQTGRKEELGCVSTTAKRGILFVPFSRLSSVHGGKIDFTNCKYCYLCYMIKVMRTLEERIGGRVKRTGAHLEVVAHVASGDQILKYHFPSATGRRLSLSCPQVTGLALQHYQLYLPNRETSDRRG
jgi:hypothetical protein